MISVNQGESKRSNKPVFVQQNAFTAATKRNLQEPYSCKVRGQLARQPSLEIGQASSILEGLVSKTDMGVIDTL